MNITKFELCNRVAKKLELQDKKIPANALEHIFETFMDEILSVMAEGWNLELRGFGSFKTKIRKEKNGKNPRTGDMVKIPAYKAPTFKFSKHGQKNFENKVKEPEKVETSNNKALKNKILTLKDKYSTIPAPSNTRPISATKTAENFRI